MFLLAYLALGACAGVLAGLLGVGGGLIIVPALMVLFAAQGLPEPLILRLALGTSLASIMFTSLSSLKSHHAKGGVDWSIFRRITPGILIGTFLGAWLAALLSTQFLKLFFIVFLYYVALRMLLDRKPEPARQLPGKIGMFCIGGLIGGISSLVGIGGGSMSVPFMVWCNVSLRNAIGTSAAIGFPIALAGAVGYMVTGLSSSHLPPSCLGYIYLPALFGISVTSIPAAPVGARLAHTLPVTGLRKTFALLLIVMGTRMLTGLIHW
jgi:uncharacterized protein